MPHLFSPEAKKTYYEALPRKGVAAAAFFLDQAGNILVLKPVYKEDWEIPGGSVEENESPREGCIREIKEEIGLDISLGRLLGIDYKPNVGYGDALNFLFYGGVLMPAEIQKITLPARELSEYRFVLLQEALTLFNPAKAKRVASCYGFLNSEKVVYLENGEVVDKR